MTLTAATYGLPGARCTRAELGADGRCPQCGRRAREEQGRVVHVRGRVAGVSPRRLGAALPALPRTAKCPDCAAYLQDRRCPWTTSTRRRLVDGIVACDRPYRDMERRGGA